MTLTVERTLSDTQATDRRRHGRVGLIVSVTAIVVGSIVGVAIGRVSSQPPSRKPLLAPTQASELRDPARGPVPERAAALLLGATRPTDGLTYAEWLHARLDGRFPGIHYRYYVQGHGVAIGRAGGYWTVSLDLTGDGQPGVDFRYINEHGLLGAVVVASGEPRGLPGNGGFVTAIDRTGVEALPKTVPFIRASDDWFADFKAGSAP